MVGWFGAGAGDGDGLLAPGCDFGEGDRDGDLDVGTAGWARAGLPAEQPLEQPAAQTEADVAEDVVEVEGGPQVLR